MVGNVQLSYARPLYDAHLAWSTVEFCFKQTKGLVWHICWEWAGQCIRAVPSHLLGMNETRRSTMAQSWVCVHPALLAALKWYLNLWYDPSIKARGCRSQKQCAGGAVPSHRSLFCWVGAQGGVVIKRVSCVQRWAGGRRTRGGWNRGLEDMTADPFWLDGFNILRSF